ncbi:MAG: DUF2911 domain-containing protein [Chitinophagaceae bacterium]|nr:DUF2911 domain-containing protein [Chitinophagaceae bacterium]
MTFSPCNIVRFCIILLCIFCCACTTGERPSAAAAVPPQNERVGLSVLDQSPLDILYYPPEYPKLKMIGKESSPPVFRIIYSRPQKNGRAIFGALIKYNEPWRLGANEATEIEFFEPVVIQHQEIPTGRYRLYCIPTPAEWTLVLNSDLYSWGLKTDPAKDLFRFTIPTIPTRPPVEVFSMETTEGAPGEALLWIAWDDVKAVLPIQLPVDRKQ